MIDLFGNDVQPPKPRKGGYASPPGGGPAGETCGSCRHFLEFTSRAGRRFFKCGLVRQGPCSACTDIRKSAPACRLWNWTPLQVILTANPKE